MIINLNDKKKSIEIVVEDRTFIIARVTLAAQAMIKKWGMLSIEAWRMSSDFSDSLTKTVSGPDVDLEDAKREIRKRADRYAKQMADMEDQILTLQYAVIEKIMADNGYEFHKDFWTESVDHGTPAAFIQAVNNKDAETQKKTEKAEK